MKRAIISGGTRGIGLAITKTLLDNGYAVTLFGRSPKEAVADVLAELHDCEYIQGDIGSAEDRKRLVDSVDSVDLLVNNAGVAPKVRADILDLTEEDYDFVVDTNLKGTFFLTSAVAKKMLSAKNGGCIINVSSISAYTSSINRAAYCISKAGISMTTKLFADRLAADGINVYEIRPGIIKTDMTATVTDKYDRLIFEENLLPIKRWGQPDDIAKAVLALATNLFPYSTGEVFNIDGGFHLKKL